VTTFNRALDAWNENNPPIPCVSGEARVRQRSIVKRDREGVESQLSRAIDQLVSVVGDNVRGILRRMEVKIYFQHVVSYRSHCPDTRASVVPYGNLLLYKALAPSESHY